VTSGDLAQLAGGTAKREPISEAKGRPMLR